MKGKTRSQIHLHNIIKLLGVFIVGLAETALAKPTADGNHTSEILVRRFSNSTPGGEPVQKVFRITQNGSEELVLPPSSFTLKSDPVKVQPDFKTVDISVLKQRKDDENAKKNAVVQEDLQSRIKISEVNLESDLNRDITATIKSEPLNPKELARKQSQIKEDIQSRLFSHDDRFYENEEHHYAIKRSDDNYYADESAPESQKKTGQTTMEPEKEDESFFSIFESLFGSSDEESPTKKKSNPEEEPMFKEPEDESIKENIKTVGDILKPLKPVDEPEFRTKNVYVSYQTEVPEYRIVNNFHASQSNNHAYKLTAPTHSNYNNYFNRPVTNKPFQPYKPHSTNGYEDYDLEEFLEKKDTTAAANYISPAVTTSVRNDQVIVTTPATRVFKVTSHSALLPSTTTTSAPKTTTTIRTTSPTSTTTTKSKNAFENKVKFPSVQKKNDYINKNRYQEVKNEVTTKSVERYTETTAYQRQEIRTTTQKPYTIKPEHLDTKANEVKPQKIHENPNFYNLINLPVRYSNKDTAIPLISTSYANTKIQGMGELKYEKGSNGKYPNHKYDQQPVATKKPNYWATKRTEAPSYVQSTTVYQPALAEDSTKHISLGHAEKVNFDNVKIGLGLELGGYGNKIGTETQTSSTPKTQTVTVSKTVPQSATVKVFSTTTTTTTRSTEPTRASGETFHDTTASRPNTQEEKFTEDYYYDTAPASTHDIQLSTQQVSAGVDYANKNQSQNELEYNKDVLTAGSKLTNPAGEQKFQEASEYEYYDYDLDTSTPVFITTTPITITPTNPPQNIRIKYPSLSKDSIKPPTNEKVAVVVPTKNHNFYNEQQTEKVIQSFASSTKQTEYSTITRATPTKPTTPTVTSAIITGLKTTVIPSTSSTTYTKPFKSQTTDQYDKSTNSVYHPNFVSKEPAPVFEEINERNDFTTKSRPILSTMKKYVQTEKPTTTTTVTTQSTVKPIIVTSSSKQQEEESNVNVVLVPTKEINKNTAKPGNKYSKPISPAVPHNPSYLKPDIPYQTGYTDYNAEFTVGTVHGSAGNSAFQIHGNGPSPQGHFVASSVATSPYGADDEPFRPIAKPSGMAISFQTENKNIQGPAVKNQASYNRRPQPQNSPDSEPIHEPHKFIPSPQFNHPIEKVKPPADVRPMDTDYEFEGIQTKPKPGQYVIFSKPLLSPEVNENQLKKKSEIKLSNEPVSNVPHFFDKGIQHTQENQKHVIFNPKEGQFYQSGLGHTPLGPENLDKPRPTFESLAEVSGELPLQLVPPRETQTEKTFEANFVIPDMEKKDPAVNYPRPHWEKNGKPPFLLNGIPKNDLSRPPSIPPQMMPTLMPPNNNPAQQFRRPPPIPQSHRKTFTEAATNVKPKPNLPNILPQFRPNTKTGSGPYHRPSAYMNSNRRNGMNRYHNKEQNNFPYHIQHPDKEAVLQKDIISEIVPKFITNRGRLPAEMWPNHGMQKRLGQGLVNMKSESVQISQPPEGVKVLKRLERTPVTTLQMLKQIPGVKTQKVHVTREENFDSAASLVPPTFKTYLNEPKPEENLFIVYPAKASHKVNSDAGKVFVVSDTESHKKFYNFTKHEDQQPLLNPSKKGNHYSERFKEDFQHGHVRGEDKTQSFKKHQHVAQVKDEEIDMNLHMQSNNQWNEIRKTSDVGSDHYRLSEHSSETQANKGRVDPPSEYQTSIKNEKNSAFTLGAVLHTLPEGDRTGEVASVSLETEDKKIGDPKLNVNERISNGKIIQVSMPLDMKREEETENQPDRLNFQAPFQASSSIDANNSGWSVVKNPEDKTDEEDGKATTPASTTKFDFENFKPELIGGFKPIFKLPDEADDKKSDGKPEREESEEEEEEEEEREVEKERERMLGRL